MIPWCVRYRYRIPTVHFKEIDSSPNHTFKRSWSGETPNLHEFSRGSMRRRNRGYGIGSSQHGYTLTEVIQLVVFLAGLTLMGLAIWATVHFIVKYW